MGTLINCGLILLGGIIGLLFKKAVSTEMEHAVQKAVGVAVVMVGLCGVLSVMLSVEDGRLKSAGELLLVVSLALGTFVGEALKLDRRIDNGCKAIVALGGGSRIDCAKGIAAKAVHPRTPVAKLQGLLKVHWPIPPFVAIPTTASSKPATSPPASLPQASSTALARWPSSAPFRTDCWATAAH